MPGPRRLRLFSLVLALPLLAQERASILIVDGINNHDWRAATRELKAILTAGGRFTVDVSTTPAADAAPSAWDAWRPDFRQYRAVVNNFNGGHTPAGIRWPGPVEQALAEYVRGGGGLVIYHAANNAFLEWSAYNDMIGLGWREKSFGPSLMVSADGTVVRMPAEPDSIPVTDQDMISRSTFSIPAMPSREACRASGCSPPSNSPTGSMGRRKA